MKNNCISLFQSQLRSRAIPVKIKQEVLSNFTKPPCRKLIIKDNQFIKKRDIEIISQEFNNLKMLPVIKSPIKLNKSNSKSPFKRKECTIINKNIKDKDIVHPNKKLTFNIIETNRTTSAEEKKTIPFNRINILFEFENASISIQRHWRGYIVRKVTKAKKIAKSKSGIKSMKGLLNLNNDNNFFTVSLSNRSNLSNLSNISISIQELDDNSSDDYNFVDDNDDF